MSGNQELWNKKYAENEETLWGLQPHHTLVEYTSLFDVNGKVLDLGMGEGRNALYFASKGFETEGVDISETAVYRAMSYAKNK